MVIQMKLYTLVVNECEILEVTVAAPSWLPVPPALPRRWLRSVAAQALRNYFKFDAQRQVPGLAQLGTGPWS